VTSPLVIDLDEVRAETEALPPCDSCPSDYAIVVEGGGWNVHLMHFADCPRLGTQPPDPKPRLSLVRADGA
jgi:hypothetical protein